jgi:hypothetical protein
VLFRRAGTNIRPFMPSTALVVAGPYKLTRNPMYLGMAGVLLGAAVLMGSLTPFVVIPAFMALISERFIVPEEAKLEAPSAASTSTTRRACGAGSSAASRGERRRRIAGARLLEAVERALHAAPALLSTWV